MMVTMAGDHGVTELGVSAYPSEVTPQMVFNFLSGGAGINVLARHVGASVVIVDMGVACDIPDDPRLINKKVGHGTKNMACGPAMTREEAIKSIESGIEILEEEIKNGLDIVGTGDMGIGNTTASAAITSVITGISPYEATGRGTGIDDSTFERKVKAIENAISLNNPDPKEGIDVLAKVGGFEIGGIAGVIICAAANHIPVVIDGYISGAAALIATTIAPRCRDYIIASHLSVEKGHKAALKHMKLEPLMDLDLRLGEGTGAALTISLVEAACKVLDEMATFADAGVSEKAK
jgi:nicotinate-nucleotide--dimethylbenzimidazole phosphoribosyltransferase